MALADDLAKYVHSVGYNDLSRETIHSAKRVILDTFGCAIGASRSEPAEIVKKSIEYSKQDKTASVIGTQRKSIPQFAAFANGTMARYFDYNDTYDGKEFAHPSDNIFPIVAVAEAEGKSGKDVVLGTVLAYEIQCRLADAACLWKRGWDHVIYGLVSVAAVSSMLMRLNEKQTAHAINIALSSHMTMRQLRSGELSMWKAPAFANSARNAIFSAVLAKNGMTGPAPIFEGEMGFWNEVSGKFQLDTVKFGNRKNRFKINDTLIKYFPAETRAQSAIWCAIEAKRMFNGTDEIKSVEIGTNEGGLRIIGSGKEKWDPQTKETADHSLPYIVAAALIDGDIEIGTFSEKRFRDRKTLELMKRITVVEKKEFTDLFNRGGTVNAADLIVKLKNGKAVRKKVIYSRGHPKNKMTDQELEEKFMKLTSSHINRDKIELLMHNIWNVERLADLSRLFQITR